MRGDFWNTYGVLDQPKISVVTRKKIVPQLAVFNALAAVFHSSSVTAPDLGGVEISVIMPPFSSVSLPVIPPIAANAASLFFFFSS